MNVFVRETVETGTHVFNQKIKADMAAGAGEFITKWRSAELGEKAFMACMNVTDMEGLQSVLSSPKAQEWNATNNAVADVYALEKIA